MQRSVKPCVRIFTQVLLFGEVRLGYISDQWGECRALLVRVLPSQVFREVMHGREVGKRVGTGGGG